LIVKDINEIKLDGRIYFSVKEIEQFGGIGAKVIFRIKGENLIFYEWSRLSKKILEIYGGRVLRRIRQFFSAEKRMLEIDMKGRTYIPKNFRERRKYGSGRSKSKT